MGTRVAIRQWDAIYFTVALSLKIFVHYRVEMGMHELLKTIGFVGLLFLSCHSYLGKVPILLISETYL